MACKKLFYRTSPDGDVTSGLKKMAGKKIKAFASTWKLGCGSTGFASSTAAASVSAVVEWRGVPLVFVIFDGNSKVSFNVDFWDAVIGKPKYDADRGWFRA
ncbi:hypothetical protein OIDMADRAFT_28004 [Oidiodendron maius Zn]|uniref:Uncharacterized protein n=1 Tax=Oidiodendron maius (strain Zn) TaxID=913774 RepID=A0A0C3HHP3_OIDMZ|nr:hypothetical protein OIDMADRAFT_28004 [Oidiodendron maius Zn]